MANLVVVGCKLPHGLQCKLVAKDGTETVVRLNGSNSNTIVGLDGKVVRGTTGYTSGVDEAFITEWMKTYKDLTAVKKGLIFIQKNLQEAKAQGADQAEQKTGFEPVSQDNLVVGVQKADAVGTPEKE